MPSFAQYCKTMFLLPFFGLDGSWSFRLFPRSAARSYRLYLFWGWSAGVEMRGDVVVLYGGVAARRGAARRGTAAGRRVDADVRG